MLVTRWLLVLGGGRRTYVYFARSLVCRWSLNGFEMRDKHERHVDWLFEVKKWIL
jgi:hypothetical protein